MSDTTPRPTAGPAAAVLDSLDDVKAALELLRRAQDRLARFTRLPCSAFALSALTAATAHASEAARLLGPEKPT